MTRWIFSGLLVGYLALPCSAQDEVVPPPSRLPEKGATPLPEKIETAPIPVEGGSCGFVEKCKTSYELHFLEREVPCVKTIQTLRPVLTPDTKPGLELDFNEEKKVCTELVLKPCEVIKEVTICTQKPIVTVDPCTHCSTVTFIPVTEVKQVKEITYQLVPVEKIITVRTAFVKPIEIPIQRKTLELDCTTENTIRKERFGVLVPVEIKERKPVCAPPPCPVPPPCDH